MKDHAMNETGSDKASVDDTYWCVETQHMDGTWHRFTIEPIEGRKEANKRLKSFQDLTFGGSQKVDASRVRLRELTDEDYLAAMSQAERDSLALQYIRSLPIPPGAFWRQKRQAEFESFEAERQAAKLAGI
jgi:hypothetical protein